MCHGSGFRRSYNWIRSAAWSAPSKLCIPEWPCHLSIRWSSNPFDDVGADVPAFYHPVDVWYIRVAVWKLGSHVQTTLHLLYLIEKSVKSTIEDQSGNCGVFFSFSFVYYRTTAYKLLILHEWGSYSVWRYYRFSDRGPYTLQTLMRGDNKKKIVSLMRAKNLSCDWCKLLSAYCGCNMTLARTVLWRTLVYEQKMCSWHSARDTEHLWPWLDVLPLSALSRTH